MKLREIIKGKIKKYGGLDLLKDDLANIRYRVPIDDRYLIDGLGSVFYVTCKMERSLTMDVLEYEALYQGALEVLKNIDEDQKNKTIIFTIELLEYQFDYVKGVRAITC